jgi:NAD+ synthase (glutamine-hydrolysing)
LTTGNKSECAVGYCTLYGDTCGGLAVIGDLFKVEVYALARYINERAQKQGRTPPIPQSSIDKPPSAELRPGQLDQDDLPPYEVLDPILHALIERELGVDDATEATHCDRALVASIAKRVRQNEYKRQQFAPTLRVSDRAWVGRQYPIAQKFFD